MKKLISVLIIITVLTGCVENSGRIPEQTPSPTQSFVQVTASPGVMQTTSPAPAPTVTVTPMPEPTPAPTTEPGVTPTPTPEPTVEPTQTTQPMQTGMALALPDNPVNPYSPKYGSPYLEDGSLTNKKMAWYYGKNKNYQPPTSQSDFDIRPFGGYYLGDTSRRVLYLTFDEGYENGYTPSILDTLKQKGVKATFFVTKPFVRDNISLVLRMIEEGHVVASHSVNHKSSPDLSDAEMISELTGLAEYYKNETGYDIAPFFRPPMGEYSARTLNITNELGYKSIFWSFAYADWDTKNQPGKDKAYTETVTHVHNGAIILLHAVSSSNTEALPDIIDTLLANGFEFLTVYDLP